jgi:hypothetical protein
VGRGNPGINKGQETEAKFVIKHFNKTLRNCTVTKMQGNMYIILYSIPGVPLQHLAPKYSIYFPKRTFKSYEDIIQVYPAITKAPPLTALHLVKGTVK